MFRPNHPILRNIITIIAQILTTGCALGNQESPMIRLHSSSPETLVANESIEQDEAAEPELQSKWLNDMWVSNPFSKHTCLISISCTRDGKKCENAAVETRLREACPAGLPPIAKQNILDPREKNAKILELSDYLCDSNRRLAWGVGSAMNSSTSVASAGILEIEIKDGYGVSKEETSHLELAILDALAIWRGACRLCSDKMWLGVKIGEITYISHSVEKLISNEEIGSELNNISAVRGLGSYYLKPDLYQKIENKSGKYNSFCSQNAIPADVETRDLLRSLVCPRESRNNQFAKKATFELRTDGTSCANNQQQNPIISMRGSLAASLPVQWCESNNTSLQPSDEEINKSNFTILGCSALDKPVELNLRDIGYYIDKRREKVIGRSKKLAPLLPVLLHEMGHWLGVPHNSEAHDLPSLENIGQQIDWSKCPAGVTPDSQRSAETFSACTILGDKRCADDTRIYYGRDYRPWSLMGDALNSMEACISTFDRNLLEESISSPDALPSRNQNKHHGFKIRTEELIQRSN